MKQGADRRRFDYGEPLSLWEAWVKPVSGGLCIRSNVAPHEAWIEIKGITQFEKRGRSRSSREGRGLKSKAIGIGFLAAYVAPRERDVDYTHVYRHEYNDKRCKPKG